MARLTRLHILCLILILGLAGCAPFLRIEQPVHSDFHTLENGSTIGQSFTATYRGLIGFAVFLKPDQPGDGLLVGHLVPAGITKTGREIARVELPLERVQQPGFYRLEFSPQADSLNQDYYFRLEFQGTGSLQAAIGPGDLYLDGAFYADGEPQDAQLTFRLAYERLQVIQGLLLEGVRWLGWLALAVLTFLLPGWAILRITLPDWDRLWWAVKAGLSGGVSAAIYPVLFLWTDLAGLQLGALLAWLPLLFGIMALILTSSRKPFQWRKAGPEFTVFIPDLAMVVLLALLVTTRFWVMRGLLVPLWGDSYQHTLITQLLVENGGLFDAWLPYSRLQSFTYHFGFHSLAAVFHWITNLPAEQATLVTGQILNILAVLGLVPLAVKIGRNRWAGVAAVFIAGFLLALPQVYINWGRYTQLAGQVILPAAAYLVWSLLSGARPKFRQVFVVGLVMSGLALTHYRVLIFGGLVFVALWLIEFDRQKALQHIWSILQPALLAMILFLPWFVRAFSGTILTLFAAQVGTPASQIEAAIQEFNTIGSVFDFMPAWLWILLFLATGWGLWRREKGAALIALWWLANLIAANPHWLNLPGTGAIGNFTVLIAIYIPAGILLGSAAGWLVEIKHTRTSSSDQDAHRTLPGMTYLLFFLLVGASLWGARQRASDLNRPSSTLFTHADQRAASWISANVPQDSLILVNSFLAYSGSLAVGSDGGWWLPLEAGRETTLPPINYDTEAGPQPGYSQQVHRLTATLFEHGLDSQESLDILNEYGVTHVYIGQRQGGVNSPGPLFKPDQLVNNPHFTLLYHEDRVWIFSFNG